LDDLATVNDKFRVKNGLRVDNELKENIFEVNDTLIQSQRTFEAISASATDVPVIIKSNLLQSADLQQWENENSETIARVDKDGKFFVEGLETISHVVIGGNLTVNGNTTTIHSTNATVEDPVIILGGESEPEFYDPKWRGVQFRWFDITPHIGFFGFDNETRRFTYIPDAVNDGEIFSGTLGDLEFNNGYFGGNVQVNGGTLSSTNTGFSLLISDVETLNFGLSATEINIGAATGKTTINHDFEVLGQFSIEGTEIDSISEALVFDLLNTPEAVNFAVSATDVQIGSATGTTNVNNNLDVDGDISMDGGDFTVSTATFNLANTTATAVNFAGAATDIQIGSSTGTTNVNNNLDVDGDINIDGGDLTASTSAFNLLHTPTTITFGAAATDLQIGSSTGTTNVNNNLDVDGDLNVDGGDLTVGTTTFNLANTVVDTVNFAGQATEINIGSASGTTTVNHNLDVEGDLKVDGGDILTSKTSINVVDTNATTVNFAGDATDIQIGSSTGITNVNNNLDVDGDLNVDGGDITSNLTSFDLLNTNVESLDFAQAATSIILGATTGTTNVRNNLDVDLDLTVKGGDIKVTTTNVNIANDTATTVNFAGAATTLNFGADTGTTTVNNNLTVKDVLTIEGTTTNFNPPTSGLAPFTVGTNAYDVLVSGLNADKLDGETGTWYQSRDNHTGTQLHTTVSDWEEAVEDTVAPMFVHSQQSGIVAQYNDETGRILLTVAGGGGGGATDFGMIYWMGV
jgi:hypothetical protein